MNPHHSVIIPARSLSATRAFTTLDSDCQSEPKRSSIVNVPRDDGSVPRVSSRFLLPVYSGLSVLFIFTFRSRVSLLFLSFSTALALALLTFFTHLPVVTPLEKLFETTTHFPLIFSALCDCLAGSVLPVERLASTVARPPLRHSDAGEIFG